MKPGTIVNTNFNSIPSTSDWDSLETSNSDNLLSFQDFTVPDLMMQKEVQPPAYMWDRIAKALDDQDQLKMGSVTHPTFAVAGIKRTSRKKVLFAAAVMVAGAIIITVS